MTTIEQWDSWAESHHSVAIDTLRILLGAFIFYKGLFFIQNTDILISLIHPVDETFNIFWLTHYVALSHLAGGLFIAVGLLTRFCSIVQLPVLAGAVLINFIGPYNGMALAQSTFVLALLLFFTFYGSGKFSVDHFLGIGIHS